MNLEPLNTVDLVKAMERIATALERVAATLEPSPEQSSELTLYDQLEGIAELLSDSSPDGILRNIAGSLRDIAVSSRPDF
jgi:hypothetical protein